MGLRAVGAATTLVLLVIPASASGAIRCLGSPGGVCDTSHATLADAYSAAGNGDTIRLGAGEFVGSLFSLKRLTFDGAGPGLTRIRRPDGDGGPGLELRASSTVRDLRVQGSGAGTGLLLEANLGTPPASYSVSNVVAVPGATGEAGLGVSDFGSDDSVTATITDTRAEPGLLASGPNVNVVLSRISAAPKDSDTPGVRLTAGAGGVLVDSRIETPAGTDAATKGVRVEGASELTMTRTFVSTDFTGLDVFSDNSRLNVFDSVVFVRQGGFDGNPVAGARVASPARLLVSGSTIASVHRDGDGAVWAQGGAAFADLRNTLVVNVNTTGTGALSSTDGGRITAVNSAFRSRTVGPGGSVSAPGSATNFAGDPLITALSPTGLALRPGSPLIDIANPAFVAAGARDVTGAARSTDGNGDCVARADIGAYERPSASPASCFQAVRITSPRASNKRFAPVKRGGKVAAKKRKTRKVKRGTRFRYTLSEAATVRIVIERITKGRRIRVKGKRVCAKPTRKRRKRRKCNRYKRVTTLTASQVAGRQSIPFTGRVKGRALKRGKYRARITATDRQGSKSVEKRIALAIVKP